jgi:hypothetical protein
MSTVSSSSTSNSGVRTRTHQLGGVWENFPVTQSVPRDKNCATASFERQAPLAVGAAVFVPAIFVPTSLIPLPSDSRRFATSSRPRAGDTTERSGIRVGEVMTPWNELSPVKYESLQTLTAGDLYKMFQGTGLTHLLVVERHDDESATAIGLVSRATLARRLHGPRGMSHR